MRRKRGEEVQKKDPPQRVVSRILFAFAGLTARLGVTIIPLVPPLLAGSSSLPGDQERAVPWNQPRLPATTSASPYLALLRAGFCLPPMLPPARCALTAPFHPYRLRPVGRSWRYIFCATNPSGCPDRGLPGALPCGVRTFLPASRRGDRLSHYGGVVSPSPTPVLP